MLYCNVHVKVSFSKHTIAVQKDSGVVEGDYNTTKLIFEFEEDVSDQRVILEMSNPKGELIFAKELSGNELILAGEDNSGNVCSIFNMEGLHPFELVLYNDTSKLTSATGYLPINKRQVRVDQGSGVDFYLPVFEETILFVRNLKEMIDNEGWGSGVTDHKDLTGRNDEKQHSISAIDGLQEKLDAMHNHSNKEVLDVLTPEVMAKFDDTVDKRHEHDNKSVLDKLSAEEGKLLFDNKPINDSSRPTGQLEVFMEEETDFNIWSDTYGQLGRIYMVDFASRIPVGTEIASVEIAFPDENNGEYINIKDMYSFDTSPYVILSNKVFYNPDFECLTYVYLLCFSTMFTPLLTKAIDYGWSKIRITYYTN